jgi:hypothetical protein
VDPRAGLDSIHSWVYENKTYYISTSYGCLFLHEGVSFASFVGIVESTSHRNTVWLRPPKVCTNFCKKKLHIRDFTVSLFEMSYEAVQLIG